MSPGLLELLPRLRRSHTDLAKLLDILPDTPVHLRKILVSQCQMQIRDLDEVSRFRARYVRELYETWIIPSSFPGEQPKQPCLLIQLCRYIAPYLDPTGSSIVIDLIRSAPFNSSSSPSYELESGIKKELQAAVDRYHPVCLNYEPILSLDYADRHSAVADNLTSYPELHTAIFSALSKCLLSFRDKLILPRCSSKLPGAEVQFNTSSFHDTYDPRSYADLEREYFQTGIKVRGSTSCRSAWKYSDLKPRVYYAQGADAYYASRFIQPLFNALVDTLPTTHTFLRYATSTVDLSPQALAFIYDYSAFTSTLHEIRCFVTALANMCDELGATTSILDTFKGIQVVSLGDMLREYQTSCNIDAEFNVLELDSTVDAILYHNCGMLGVPGNISSCTLLHGIHLILLLGAIRFGKCIGDDAYGVAHSLIAATSSKQGIFSALSNIGSLALDKMEFWSVYDDYSRNNTWKYAKRPLNIISGRAHIGHMIIAPQAANALDLRDEFHSVRPRTLRSRCIAYANQALRFIRDHNALPRSSEVSRSLAFEILKTYHSFLGFDRSGQHSEFPDIWCPSVYLDRDPYISMIEDRLSDLVSLPVTEPDVDMPITYRAGGVFQSRSGRIMTLWEKLGLVKKSALRRTVVLHENVSEVVSMLKGISRPVYQYVVLSDIPAHLYVDLDGFHHVPYPVPYEVTRLWRGGDVLGSDTSDDDSE